MKGWIDQVNDHDRSKMLSIALKAGNDMLRFIESPEGRKVEEQYRNSALNREYPGMQWFESMNLPNKEQRMNEMNEMNVNDSSQLKSMSLLEYQCHKRVRAVKITGLKIDGHKRFISFTPHPMWSSNSWIEFAPEWIEQHKPQIGGYVVRYEDGYQSYSPAKAFEEGYTMVPVQDNSGNGSINSGELDQRDRVMNERSGSAIKAKLDEIKQNIRTGNNRLTPSIAQLVRDSAYQLTQELKKHGYSDVAGYVKCMVESKDQKVLASCLSDVQFYYIPLPKEIVQYPTGTPVDKFTNKSVGRTVHYIGAGMVYEPAVILYVNPNDSCLLLVHGITEDRRIDYVRFGVNSGEWKWPV